MPDARRLPDSYVQTFREAVQAVDHLRQGGLEMPIAHEGRPVRIGYIIGVALHYRDRMPDDLHAQLCEAILDQRWEAWPTATSETGSLATGNAWRAVRGGSPDRAAPM